MGLLHKKVRKDLWTNNPIFGDPADSLVKRKSREFSTTRADMIEKQIINFASKMSNKENMWNLIKTMNGIHTSDWLRHTTPFMPKRHLREVTEASQSEILSQFPMPSGYKATRYSSNPTSNLAIEYMMKQKIPSYNYDTKEFIFKTIYRFKYLGNGEVKCVYREPQPNPPLPQYTYEFELNEVLELVDPRLGIATGLALYVRMVLKKKCREALKANFGVDYYDKKQRVEEKLFSYEPLKEDEFDTTKVVVADVYYTWKGHTQKEEKPITNPDGTLGVEIVEVQKYENIQILDTMPLDIYNEYKNKGKKKSYIEAKNLYLTSRTIFAFEFIPNGASETEFDGEEWFTAVLPIKGPKCDVWEGVPEDENSMAYRRWRKALIDGGYKSKYTKRKPRLPKHKRRYDKDGKEIEPKSLYEEIKANGDITHCAVTQFIDLRWFYRAKLRNNKYWHKYLKEIWKLFRSVTGVDYKYGGKEEGKYIRIWGAEFKLLLTKREITDTPCSHRCLIGPEIGSTDIYLYLNEPIKGQRDLDTFTDFTQYGINLNKFWIKADRKLQYTPEDVDGYDLEKEIRDFDHLMYDPDKALNNAVVDPGDGGDGGDNEGFGDDDEDDTDSSSGDNPGADTGGMDNDNTGGEGDD